MSDPFDEIKAGFEVLKKEWLAARREQSRPGATAAERQAADQKVEAVAARWKALRDFEKKLSKDMGL
jgi:hypothetical protein